MYSDLCDDIVHTCGYCHTLPLLCEKQRGGGGRSLRSKPALSFIIHIAYGGYTHFGYIIIIIF